MSSSRSLRTLRGVVAATVATLTALFSHVAGGGELPGALGVAAPLVLAVPVCVALAGRRLSLARLGASVGLSQLLFHALFGIGGAAGSAAGPAGAAHLHGGPIDLGAAAHPALHDSSMGIAHVLAAVVTIAALHRGEALLIAVAATTAHLVTVLVRVPPTPVRAPRPARRSTFALHGILPVAAGVFPPAVPRRGPPTFPAS